MSSKDKKINIVMFNMSAHSEWQAGVHNRNHQILTNLLKNEEVSRILAVDFLPHTFKRVVRNYFENVLSSSDYKIVDRGIFSKTFQVDDKLIVHSSVTSKFSKKLFYNNLKNLLKKLKFENYLLWSYYPLEVGYFDQLKPDLNIFDAVDDWSEHPSFVKFKGILKANYEKIAEQADIIFTVAEQQQAMFDKPEKVFWLPNGVDLKHYQTEYQIVNRDIGQIKSPVIGYLGTIQARFDLELLEYLVKANPEKNFVLVGPVWYRRIWENTKMDIMERFRSYNNVFFLGRKPYEEIPMYLQQFDLGIIPHKLDQFIRSTNPMKIYDYLASGLPIVSTQGTGIKEIDDLVLITDDFKEFNQLMQKALSDNSPAEKAKRLEVIKNHSWLRRVDNMLEIIKRHYE